ncbi:hypothetical protein [Legionella sp.]|uniref:hypothetical protein n=1 Tax=Legionella sp. TaxID=459 RepID=UPI003C8E0C35
MSSNSFFKAPERHANQRGENYEVINVGGEQFHAVAVALIDYLQSNSQVNDVSIKKILRGFSQYFPQYVIHNSPSMPSTDLMRRLLNSPRKTELIECMAYVLRQLTVDELYADHVNLNYRNVFEHLTAKTAKNYLRKPDTQLPVCALKALQHTLGLSIILSFKEPGKELRRREKNFDNNHAALLIQVQDYNKYYPQVKHKEDFSSVGQLDVTVKPIEIPSENEGTINDIVSAINTDNQERLHTYEQQTTKILSMVAAGELSYEQLRDYYIVLVPFQLNNAPFITQLQQTINPVIVKAQVHPEQHTILLATTLASWIAAGAITEDQLFDRIENIQVGTLAR